MVNFLQFTDFMYSVNSDERLLREGQGDDLMMTGHQSITRKAANPDS